MSRNCDIPSFTDLKFISGIWKITKGCKRFIKAEKITELKGYYTKQFLKGFFTTQVYILCTDHLTNFFQKFMGGIGKAMMILLNSVKGRGSWFSTCSLMKLLYSNLLLILQFNNPTNKSLSDLQVYFKLQVYFRATCCRMEEY